MRFSSKLTLIQASLKQNEGFAYHILLDKRGTKKLKFEIHDLVRTADLQRTFPKGDTANWSHTLYEITEVANDLIPVYKLDQLSERYNEAFLKKTQLSMKEVKD